ncbi:MAG: hypothetical protein IT449_01030 [Phycisphaerales bacterium]|nr:hypothetical protein [Phycisphaerales bacterium]
MTGPKPALSTYDELRAKIIHETELALLMGLLHPESVPRIPMVEVGKGTFSRDFAREFWRDAAGIEDPEVQMEAR